MSLSEVKKIEKIYNSPVGAFVIRGVAETEAAGLMFGLGAPGWDTNALYLEDDGQVVAILVWSVQEWKQSAYVDFGYVLPGRRGQGLYTKLWNALIDEAKERKLRTIGSGTHVKNTAMQAIAAKQGRVAESISFRYDVIYSDAGSEAA